RAGLGPGGVRQAAVIRRNEHPVRKEALGHGVEQAVRGGDNYAIVDDRGRALKIAHAKLGEEQLPCRLVGIGSDGPARRDAGERVKSRPAVPATWAEISPSLKRTRSFAAFLRSAVQ